MTQALSLKGLFLYDAVSSPLDCSKRFTLPPPLADLFIPTPTLVLWESFSPCKYHLVTFTCKYYLVTFTPPSIGKYSFIQLSELRHHGETETVAKGIQTRASPHSTAELPRSTSVIAQWNSTRMSTHSATIMFVTQALV